MLQPRSSAMVYLLLYAVAVLQQINWVSSFSCLPWKPPTPPADPTKPAQPDPEPTPVAWWLIIQGRQVTDNPGYTYFDSTGYSYEYRQSGGKASRIGTVADPDSAMFRTMNQVSLACP